MADQGFRIGAVLREDGDPDRDAEEDLVTGNFKRQTDRINQTVGDARGFGGVLDLGQQNGELIAAKTGNQARLTFLAGGHIAAACHF